MSMFESMLDEIGCAVAVQLEEDNAYPIKDARIRWPLDKRALPFGAFFTEDYLAVPVSSVKSLDYYGGFEYVEPEHRFSAGDWTFYSRESERVADVLEALLDGAF